MNHIVKNQFLNKKSFLNSVMSHDQILIAGKQYILQHNLFYLHFFLIYQFILTLARQTWIIFTYQVALYHSLIEIRVFCLNLGATQYTARSQPVPNSICGNRFTTVTNGVSLVKTICSKLMTFKKKIKFIFFEILKTQVYFFFSLRTQLRAEFRIHF